MPRFTLDKFSARKLHNQLSKDANKYLIPLFNEMRQSTPSSGEVVLWDPPVEIVDGCIRILEREQSFARDKMKGNAPYLSINETIGKLKTYREEQFGEPYTPPTDPSLAPATGR